MRKLSKEFWIIVGVVVVVGTVIDYLLWTKTLEKKSAKETRPVCTPPQVVFCFATMPASGCHCVDGPGTSPKIPTRLVLKDAKDAEDMLMPTLCPREEMVCNFNFLRTDPPDSKQIEFITKYDLILTVPTNNRWGTAKFGLPPVWEEPVKPGTEQMAAEFFAGFSFGPLEHTWGGIGRRYRVYIQPPISAEKIIGQLKGSRDFTVPPKIISLQNGLTAVQYESYGLGFSPTIVVLGPKYNYVLMKFATAAGEFDILEDAANSIRLE